MFVVANRRYGTLGFCVGSGGESCANARDEHMHSANVASKRRARDVISILGLQGRLVNQRAHIGPGLATITETEPLHPFDEHLHQSVMHAALHDQARRRGTPLSRRTERPPQHPVQCQLEVGVVQDDLSILAPHLQR